VVGIIVVLMLATGMLSLSLAQVVEGKLPAQATAAGLILLLGSVFFLNIFYYVFFELTTNGQSQGKRIVGLRVIHDGGQSLGASASLTRNISRVIDFLPGPYLVAFISALISSKGQRVGDLIAGTVVIRHAASSMPLRPFPQQAYSSLPQVTHHFERLDLVQLGPEAFHILDEFYRRGPQLTQKQREQIQTQLLEDIGKQMSKNNLAIESNEVFLKELYLALREHLEA